LTDLRDGLGKFLKIELKIRNEDREDDGYGDGVDDAIVERVGTAFVAAEGRALINNRFEAAKLKHGITDKLPIAWPRRLPDFTNADDIKIFIREMKKPLAEVQSKALLLPSKLRPMVESAPVTARVWDWARQLLRENPQAPLPEALKLN
jgi:hypothetical protein